MYRVHPALLHSDNCSEHLRCCQQHLVLTASGHQREPDGAVLSDGDGHAHLRQPREPGNGRERQHARPVHLEFSSGQRLGRGSARGCGHCEDRTASKHCIHVLCDGLATLRGLLDWRLVSVHALRHLEALLDARAEVWLAPFDEVGVHAPDLASLQEAKRVPPSVQQVARACALGYTDLRGLRAQRLAYPLKRIARELAVNSLGARLLGELERVGCHEPPRGAPCRRCRLAPEHGQRGRAQGLRVAREDARRVEGRRERRSGRQVPPPVRRPQAVDAAEGRGDAHAPTGVRTEREVHEARSHGGGAAGARPTWDAIRSGRVERRPVVRVLPVERVRELIHFCLAHEHRASAPERRNCGRVGRGLGGALQPRGVAEPGARACDVEEVLGGEA
mmetsp:Transcript_12757/g.53647  ORF Transcript_12757/g.53647 Transcript_12757/m.53647 type:complete len:391 (-) Transcript_12757:311-1483(-)